MMIQKTAATPEATKYRGQRSVVLACLKQVGGKATLETLVAHCEKAGYKMPGPQGKKYAGGVRGSVLYHLRGLEKAKEVKLDGDAGKVARVVEASKPAKRAKKAKQEPTVISQPAAEQEPAA